MDNHEIVKKIIKRGTLMQLKENYKNITDENYDYNCDFINTTLVWSAFDKCRWIYETYNIDVLSDWRLYFYYSWQAKCFSICGWLLSICDDPKKYIDKEYYKELFIDTVIYSRPSINKVLVDLFPKIYNCSNSKFEIDCEFDSFIRNDITDKVNELEQENCKPTFLEIHKINVLLQNNIKISRDTFVFHIKNHGILRAVTTDFPFLVDDKYLDRYLLNIKKNKKDKIFNDALEKHKCISKENIVLFIDDIYLSEEELNRKWNKRQGLVIIEKFFFKQYFKPKGINFNKIATELM